LGTLSCYPGDTNVWNDSCAYAQEFPGRSLRSLTTNAPWLSRRIYRRNVQVGDCLQGMLTKNGATQHRSNGHRVYSDYVKGDVARVLPQHWDSAPGAFYIRSTDIERTFVSAESLFAGIYENVTAPSSTDAIDVIAIESREGNVETMYPNPTVCPQQAVLAQQAKLSAPFVSFVNTVAAPVLARVSAEIGANVTWTLYEELLDCTRSLLCNRKTLPAALSSQSMLEMAAMQAWDYNYVMTYPNAMDAARLQMGLFFGELLDHIANAPDTLAFSLFSAHDTSILPMLLALNQTDVIWPAYACHLKFEIEKDSNGDLTYVSIKYNDELMSLPACGNSSRCAWSDFQAFVSNLVPTQQQCTQ